MTCRQRDEPVVFVEPCEEMPLGGYRCATCCATSRRVQPPKNFSPPRTVAGWLLALALAGAPLGAPACATLGTPAGQGATTEQARLQELSRLADVANQVLTVTREIQQLEIVLHDGQLVPDSAHRTIQEAFLAFSGGATQGLLVARDLSRSDADRRNAVSGFITIANHLVGQVAVALPPGALGQVRVALSALRAALVALQLAV